MALSATSFETAFKYKVIQETACDESAIVNAATSAGSIHAIEFVNSSSAASFKFFDTDVVTMGSTFADMVFRIPANATTVIDIPEGLPFTCVSFAVTANPNPIDNTAPAAGVTVRLLVS
tara:strand:- start:98 stop:454 length:357 start_codon:yes stop_codon:yes gene_type:complete